MYRSLLLDAIAGQNEAAGANRDPDLIEAAAAEVEKLIPKAFGIFKLIAESPGDKKRSLILLPCNSAA